MYLNYITIYKKIWNLMFSLELLTGKQNIPHCRNSSKNLITKIVDIRDKSIPISHIYTWPLTSKDSPEGVFDNLKEKVWHHAGKTNQAYFSLKRGKYKYIYCKKKPSSFPSIAWMFRGLELWCLTSLSTIFQLCTGKQNIPHCRNSSKI
jgi:hypothetical protein